MAILSIPTNARDKLKGYAEQIRGTDDKDIQDYYEAEVSGFFDGLRCCLPSEVVGLLVMDFDEFKDGRGAFTETLPTLRFGEVS